MKHDVRLSMDFFHDDLNIPLLDRRKCMVCGQIPVIYYVIFFEGEWIEVNYEIWDEICEVNKQIAKDNIGKPKKEKERLIGGRIDRSSRVDCDISKGNEPSRYQVFCTECYWKEMQK